MYVSGSTQICTKKKQLTAKLGGDLFLLKDGYVHCVYGINFAFNLPTDCASKFSPGNHSVCHNNWCREMKKIIILIYCDDIYYQARVCVDIDFVVQPWKNLNKQTVTDSTIRNVPKSLIKILMVLPNMWRKFSLNVTDPCMHSLDAVYYH